MENSCSALGAKTQQQFSLEKKGREITEEARILGQIKELDPSNSEDIKTLTQLAKSLLELTKSPEDYFSGRDALELFRRLSNEPELLELQELLLNSMKDCPEGVAEVQYQLKRNSSSELRARCVIVCHLNGDKASVFTALGDKHAEVRELAVSCLWDIKAPNQVFLDLLDDPAPLVRESALRALNTLSRTPERELKENDCLRISCLSSDPSPFVRSEARSIIMRAAPQYFHLFESDRDYHERTQQPRLSDLLLRESRNEQTQSLGIRLIMKLPTAGDEVLRERLRDSSSSRQTELALLAEMADRGTFTDLLLPRLTGMKRPQVRRFVAGLLRGKKGLGTKLLSEFLQQELGGQR